MKILPPSDCPSCGSPLELVNSQLFCRNSGCLAQGSKKIEHFCKTMKLKGFGPKAVKKLEIEHASELMLLSEQDFHERLGSATIGTKLYNEVQDKLVNASIDLGQLIASMSIPLVGATAGRKLMEAITKPTQLNTEKCKSAGLGDKATANLMQWLEEDWYLNWDHVGLKFAEAQVAPEPVAIKAEVCITGKLNDFSNRTEATKYLEALGFIVKNTVTKSVSVLICEDDSKVGSSSYKKAKDNGIEILSIKQLIARG